MNRKSLTAGVYVTAAVLSSALAPRALAQAAPAAEPAETPGATDQDVVVLSPFVVNASEDRGYVATSTLAGTRVRTNLRDVGSSISVVTEGFLRDTNSKNAESLLVYTANTEVVGQGGNFLGQGDGPFVTASALNRPVSNTRVRGLAEADNTRDFFRSDIPWDTYNVGRVDLQRGPNSVLFGIGSPAGIVNSSINQASFRTAHKLDVQFGSFGTWRLSGDFNQVLLPDELALRVDLLNDQTKFQQDPAFRDDKRVFAALRYDPSFLNKGTAKTSFRLNYEAGNIDSNMPRYTPPIDTYTQWFSGLNQATYDGRTLNNGVPNAYIGPIGNRVYDGVVTTYNPDGSQSITYPTKVQGNPPSSVVGNNGLKGIATTDLYAKQAHLVGAGSGLWKAQSLTDRGIFDFYNHLLEGPNKSEFNNFHALNVALSQTFLNNKLGFEIVYDVQDASWGNDTVMAEDGATITVDINQTLLDGSANPHVGEAMVVLGGGSAGVYREVRSRDNLRFTGFGELNFHDLVGRDSFVAKVFGRNVFTVLASREKEVDKNMKGPRWYLPNNYHATAARDNIGQASRDNIQLVYAGDATMGLGFQGLKQKIHPAATSTVVWDSATSSFQNAALSVYDATDFADADKTYTQGFRSRNVIDSGAIVWQGYWLDDTIIPMIGLRRDRMKHRGVAAPGLTGVGGAVDVSGAGWDLPTEPVNPSNNPKGQTFQNASGNSKTFSIVTHLPKAWRNKLPGRLDLSLFANQSENFKPESRRDLLSTSLPNATGKTKEYGFALSAFDDKVTFKAVHYDTKVKNATLSGALAGFYLIGANEWWGGNAARAQRDNSGWQAGNFGTTTDGQVVTVQPDITVGNTTYNAHLAQVLTAAGVPLTTGTDANGNPIYSQLALDTTWADYRASIDDWFANLAPAAFQSAWEFVSTADGVNNHDGNYSPSGMALTGDTHSKGWEFEISAQPIAGLDISFNASKTSAQRSNLAQSYTTWITQRWEDLQGPMGDIRIWGGGANGETTRSKFRNETYAGWLFFNALQGADVPELRPWNFALVTNYSFSRDTVLKGANVGFSYRWSDKNVIGFYSRTVTDEISGQPIDVADLSRPIDGERQDAVDFWIGYERDLSHGVRWRIQLNVRNLFADDDLIPTTMQPDGTVATYRIPEPRTWTISNTFSF
ncbi:MAG TPA: TonB-dependent receptor plug domain-containing protein [Opitutaceae bacterium]|nr:TonB-dependent receptor plug domain-containing protein [Opitutaceae bacterium]